MAHTHIDPDKADRGQENGDQSRRSGETELCPRCGHTLSLKRGDLWPSWLPDPREEPTVPVWPVVGKLLGRKRSAILACDLTLQAWRAGRRSCRRPCRGWVLEAGLRRSLGMSGWCVNTRWCGAGTNFRDHAVVEHA
jgi:hypothetical protein